MQWEYRTVQKIEEFEQIVDLEIAVWGLEPRDAAPSSLMHAMAHGGALVAAAYNGEQIIGMTLAFPAKHHNRWILWSHMAAVHPNYQNQGIGFGLKQFQRTWALEQGYNLIAWTFDPLQPGNARFNLHYLGAKTNSYHINFYGQMTDSINAGLPSDRLEVHWDLRRGHTQRTQSSKKATPKAEENTPYLLHSQDGKPIIDFQLNDNQLRYYVEIPLDLALIRQANSGLALQWRLALREVLCKTFAAGWTATDFISTDEANYYELTASPWFLYVVACNDNSLYTGISPDVIKRVAIHNKGRGAAYTAARRPVKLVAAWRFKNRSVAMKAEIVFKQLSRQHKLNFISMEASFEDAPFIHFQTS